MLLGQGRGNLLDLPARLQNFNQFQGPVAGWIQVLANLLADSLLAQGSAIRPPPGGRRDDGRPASNAAPFKTELSSFSPELSQGCFPVPEHVCVFPAHSTAGWSIPFTSNSLPGLLFSLVQPPFPLWFHIHAAIEPVWRYWPPVPAAAVLFLHWCGLTDPLTRSRLDPAVAPADPDSRLPGEISGHCLPAAVPLYGHITAGNGQSGAGSCGCCQTP